MMIKLKDDNSKNNKEKEWQRKKERRERELKNGKWMILDLS